MSKIISIEYNGELGYASSIEDVVLDVFQIYEITPDQFLDFKNGDISNRELVFVHYQMSEKIKYNLADDEGNITKTAKDITPQMRCPYITFFIDAKYVTKDIIINNSSVLVDDFAAKEFTADEEEQADSDGRTKFITNKFFFEKVKIIPKITKNNPLDSVDDNTIKGTRRQYINPRVWIWCKSLNEDGNFNSNSIFDLTPFITTMDMNTSDTGGNFSISLNNIEGFVQTYNNEAFGVWNPRKERYIKFKQDNKMNYLFKNALNARYNTTTDELFQDNYMANQNSYDSAEDRDYKQKNLDEELMTESVDVTRTGPGKSLSSDLFFKNLISENDIIFITFRDDEDNEIETVDDFFIGNDKLPNMSWEMIGLVDKNSVGITYEGTEYNVSVAGRDLMKLLIEDGSYFFANSFADDDTKSIFQNVDLPNRGDSVNASNHVMDKDYVKSGANRLVMSGLIDMLFNPEARNVHFVMNLLMSTLSNIEICPSRLFEYQQNKTKFQIPKFETVKK